MQADPLGLVDGESVFGYVVQRPTYFVDPTGEFGLPGSVIGAVVSGGSQLLVNVYIYGDVTKALLCIDIGEVFMSAAIGALGGNAAAVFKSARKAGRSAVSSGGRAAGTAVLGSYLKLGLSYNYWG